MKKSSHARVRDMKVGKIPKKERSTKMLITPEFVSSLHPCQSEEGEIYSLPSLQKLLGEGKPPLEIIDGFNEIPVRDKLWLLLRPEIIPERKLHELACVFADHVLSVWEKRFPDDYTLHRAVAAKRLWLDGHLSDEELRIACPSIASRASRAALDVSYVSAAEKSWQLQQIRKVLGGKMKRVQTLTLLDRPLGSNKFVNKIKGNYVFSKRNKEIAELVFYECQLQKIEPIVWYPVKCTYIIEMKRPIDLSNFSEKMYEDALIKAGILQDDSNKFVNCIVKIPSVCKDGKDKVIIKIEEGGSNE